MSAEKAFAYNGYKQIAEYTVSGTTKTLSKSTVWQPAASGDLDVVLWYRDGSTVYTLLPDGNKNTRQLKTTAGTVVATYDYDPFGNIIATTGTVTNPWLFSSEYYDSETNLVYYNYRDYAPSQGRWISRDISPAYKDMITLFVAVKNNLINRFDALGLWDGLVPIFVEWLGLYTGCCNGEKYDRGQKCCCNDKIKNKNDEYIITIYYAGAFWGLPSHVWLEWESGSAGFYGWGYGPVEPTVPGDWWEEYFGIGRGSIYMPEDPKYTNGPKRILRQIIFSSCKYDLDNIEAELLYIINYDLPFYTFTTVNCEIWASQVVNNLEKRIKCGKKQ